MLEVLDLFSGIGGFSLGLEMTGGFKTFAFCEIDGECRKVLKKHWPDTPIYEDVRTIENVKADVVCGGYPCQPYSVAGNQKAAEDHRDLWPEMFKIITQCRPSWVIAENVYGHIKLGLDNVLNDLESEGYSARPIVLSSLCKGADHRRERVFIIAHTSSDGRNGGKTARGDGEADEHSEEGTDKNSNHERCGGVRTGMEGYSDKAGTRGTKPPPIRVDDGLPGRMDRNRMIGNSVDPRLVKVIGGVILSLEKTA